MFNHAKDRFLIVDDVLFPLYEKFADQVSFERVIVVPFGFASVPEGFLNYEELLADESGDFSYPAMDENQGALMCFTSGTTGCSKGVIYSHRALVLHSFSLGLQEVFGLGYQRHDSADGADVSCQRLGHSDCRAHAGDEAGFARAASGRRKPAEPDGAGKSEQGLRRADRLGRSFGGTREKSRTLETSRRISSVPAEAPRLRWK